MRKALASMVVIVFAGLLCTSLLSIFGNHSLVNGDSNLNIKYPYYMSY